MSSASIILAAAPACDDVRGDLLSHFCPPDERCPCKSSAHPRCAIVTTADHQFLAQQPDLNWRNPAVQAAMYDAVRFWLAKGVDGFRVDAFAYLFETEDLTADEPASTGEGYHAVVPTNTENVAPLQQQMANLSKVVKAFGPDRVLVGEVYADPPVITDADVLSFYGSPAAPSLDMPFNFTDQPLGRLVLLSRSVPHDQTRKAFTITFRNTQVE